MRSRFGSEVSTQVLKRYIRGGSPLVAKNGFGIGKESLYPKTLNPRNFTERKKKLGRETDFCLYWAKFVIDELVINGEHSSFSPGVYRH